MRKTMSGFFLCLVCSLLIMCPAVATIITLPGHGEVLADQVVVRLSNQAAARHHLHKALARDKSLFDDCIPEPLQEKKFTSIVTRFRPCASGPERMSRIFDKATRDLGSSLEKMAADNSAILEDKIARAMDEIGPEGVFVAYLTDGVLPEHACLVLEAHPEVVYAHPSPVMTPASAPNDPYYPRMWNLDQIRVEPAWSHLEDRLYPVRVAVIDTGVCITHPELQGRIIAPKDVYPDNGDAYGNTDPEDDDPDGHGTSSAGIIAAISNNNTGIAGIAPVSIIPVNGAVWNTTAKRWRIANYWEGIYHAVDHGAFVVNMSLGGERASPYQFEVDAFNYAERNGVMLVASAGNTDGHVANNIYPSAFPYVISVSAVDDTGSRVCSSKWWWGSSYGSVVELCAPGQANYGTHNDSIITLDRMGAYRYGYNGTSAAAPHVAGVIALLKCIRPQLTNLDIRAILHNTARDRVGIPEEDIPGRDIYHGYGLVDAEAAVNAVISLYTPLTVLPKKIIYGMEGGSGYILVESPGASTQHITVKKNADWIRFPLQLGNVDTRPGLIEFHVARAHTRENRKSNITITRAGDSVVHEVQVEQLGNAVTVLTDMFLPRGSADEPLFTITDLDNDGYASKVHFKVPLQYMGNKEDLEMIRVTITCGMRDGAVFVTDVSPPLYVDSQTDQFHIALVDYEWTTPPSVKQGVANFFLDMHLLKYGKRAPTLSGMQRPELNGVKLENVFEDRPAGYNSVTFSNNGTLKVVEFGIRTSIPTPAERTLDTPLLPGNTHKAAYLPDGSYSLYAVLENNDVSRHSVNLFGGIDHRWTIAGSRSGPGASLDEIALFLLENFHDADLNGDGRLSFGESVSAVPHLTSEEFSRIDYNADGYLSREELNRFLYAIGNDGSTCCGFCSEQGQLLQHRSGDWLLVLMAVMAVMAVSRAGHA